MRRAVFAIALIAGIATGVSAVAAQQGRGIGGDLNWPTTSVVDDPPVQQAKPKPGPAADAAPASTASTSTEQAPAPAAQDAGAAAASSERPIRKSGQQDNAAQTRREQNNEARPRSEPEREARPIRSAARETASRDIALVPPVPVRREDPSAAPPASAARQSAPVSISLAQTMPGPEQDDGLGKIIGQMLVVGFQGAAPDESWPRQVAGQIESGKLGGVLFMSRNLTAPNQVAKLTALFSHTKAQTVPFIAVDQEGGRVQRLPVENGFHEYASAAELGMSNDPLNAYNLYQRMAIELSSHGFNVNLGPVVDLDEHDHSGAANESRYGTQPKHVAAFAKAFRLAHRGEGLLTVLKHFPGLAGAQPVSGGKASAQGRWDAAALEPYSQLIAGGNADMVMVGHLAHPDFSDEPSLPASLSQKTVQTRLREEIGFKGVIICDDLEDKAVAARFPLEERVVRAIKAGNDLLLISNQTNPSPDLPEKVAKIVKEAVAAGTLTRERLKASYDRILAAKQSLSQSAREIASAKQPDSDEEKPSSP